MIQCIGSRNEDFPNCSRVCCTNAISNALEIKKSNPDMYWKQIAMIIKWRFGSKKEGVKLLEDARKRLQEAGPQLLSEIDEYRGKKKKKNQ